MNIKEKLTKWKRAIYRNRKEISKAISITLTVALVAFVAYYAYGIFRDDRIREEEANRPIDEGKIKIPAGWDYGESGFNQVAENDRLTLEADFTTGEIRVTDKESGKQWYSNPPDRANDKIAPYMSKLNSQFYASFLDTNSVSIIEFDNYTASIRKGGMSYELVENGIKFKFAFPVASVYIPIQYTLCEDGFQAEVLTNEVERVGDKAYHLQAVSLLPFFGAGGLNDDGYVFIPDGSGVLMNYNNNKDKFQTYTSYVYGADPSFVQKTLLSVQERISLPIFGAKCNDSAFLAVILSGDTKSKITASTSRRDSSYNTVYPIGEFIDYRFFEVPTGGDYSFGSDYLAQFTKDVKFTDGILNGGNYAVRYFFLNDEKANYTGMSERYREFLVENDLLKESPLADEKYLILDLIGAVSIEKYVFGIKMPVVTALTTYNDVCTIVKELKAQGVDNLIINYIGALDNGMDNKIPTKVSTESVLGSKKEFRAMIDYLEKENVQLFLELNPVDLHVDGNGYKGTRDGVRTLYDTYSFQYKYRLDSLKKIDSSRWYLMNPNNILDLVSGFADSMEKWNIKNLSIDRIGDVLYSEYRDKAPETNRLTTLDIWRKTLQAASDKSEYLMVHVGNVYTAAYADVITDVPDGGSNFEMTDDAIPFYQMVFQSNTVIGTNPVNETVDYTLAAMKTLESGASLKYNLIYGNVSQLVGTEYNTMVSYSYEYWKDIIVEQYHMMQSVTKEFAGQEITWHEVLSEDVSLTVYETGKVVVNYGDESYYYGGIEVKPRDYLVLPGGVK